VIDHVVAKQHGGADESGNLALCCGRCNQHKGPNIAGVDPETGAMMRLFHPRRDLWSEHFQYEGGVVVGLTEIGRATAAVLAINLPIRVASRTALIDTGFVF
jgi:cation diffusion facilitator CzcD-associated flavoprotein CzcO